MSRPRFLRSVVFLSAFITPIVVTSAQRQNTSEPLASSPVSSRRAAPTKIRQAVPVPGMPFDPRQRLHAPGASTLQTNSLADPRTAATLATGTSLSASTMFLEAPVFSSGGYSANSVAVADVNGDGKLDLLVANFCTATPCGGDGTVGVLLGNGDGTFQPAVTYDSGGQNTVSIAVADVNSDGKPDAVVTDNCVTSTCDAGAVGVLLGNGDGTFQAAVNYTSGGLSPSSVVVGDVNGDGKPDLLVGNIYMGNGNYSRGSVGLLLGNGDGTFLGPVSFDSGGEYAYGVAVGDINGDGKLDLFVANFCADSTCASGGVAVFLGKGDGSFQPVVTYGSGGLNSYSVAVGDVNADGKPDLLIGDPDPFYDDCGGPEQIAMTGTNVGDLLNAKGVTWGWFQGGFTPTTPASASSPAGCAAATTNLGGSLQKDYSAHHEPFQYYKSTANPHHLPPTSVSMIGKTDQANHQYDLTDFWNAV